VGGFGGGGFGGGGCGGWVGVVVGWCVWGWGVVLLVFGGGGWGGGGWVVGGGFVGVGGLGLLGFDGGWGLLLGCGEGVFVLEGTLNELKRRKSGH